MRARGKVGRKEIGDPSRDAKETLDSMQAAQAQGSSQGWRASPWKDLAPWEESDV